MVLYEQAGETKFWGDFAAIILLKAKQIPLMACEQCYGDSLSMRHHCSSVCDVSSVYSRQVVQRHI